MTPEVGVVMGIGDILQTSTYHRRTPRPRTRGNRADSARGTFALVVISLVFGCALGWQARLALSSYNAQSPQTPGVEAYFSPKGGAQTAIVEVIDSADTEAFAVLYHLTDPILSGAFVHAEGCGVQIRTSLIYRQNRPGGALAHWLYIFFGYPIVVL